ncbi:uncharacterized protein V6R79_004995 [Siganus canaliculatus]
MGKVVGLASCVLMSVAAAAAQEDQTVQSGRAVPQWGVGLLAVAGFLFLAFVSILAKKAWCYKDSRSKENPHAYNNVVIQNSEVKITAM